MSTSRLRDALGALKIISRQNQFPLEPKDRKIVEIASTIQFNRAVRPPKVRFDVAAKWKLAVGAGDFSSITRGDIRYLFWEREIALTPQFLDLVFDRQMFLRRSAVKGLVFAVASCWDDIRSGKLQLHACQLALNKLSKTDYLEGVSPFIFDEQGPRRFADLLVANRMPVSSQFSEVFGLVIPSSPYTDDVIGIVSKAAFKIALSVERGERDWFYGEILRCLDKARLVECLGQIVAAIEASNAEEAKEELKGFILSHPNLGDPRLPGFEGNWDMRDPITNSIIEWLSQSDINFFFELFFQERADVQGRKKFWLPYAHLIRGTRVIISQADQQRLFKKIAKMDQKQINQNIFGKLVPNSEIATAFIMDFGSVKVVEFSLPGHACFIYSQDSKFKFNERAIFWSTKEFQKTDLKNEKLAAKRLLHKNEWQADFENALARFGIRKKVSPRSKTYG